jgi:hypothetical protein
MKMQTGRKTKKSKKNSDKNYFVCNRQSFKVLETEFKTWDNVSPFRASGLSSSSKILRIQIMRTTISYEKGIIINVCTHQYRTFLWNLTTTVQS